MRVPQFADWSHKIRSIYKLSHNGNVGLGGGDFCITLDPLSMVSIFKFEIHFPGCVELTHL